MTSNDTTSVAIVDYGVGNLYSVKRACAHVGLSANITSDPEALSAADGIILPGVGAFGRAMQSLRELGLVDAIQGEVRSGKPLMGVCLGIQLLMTESFEFGHHEGLNIIPGRVVPFENVREGDRALKVPQICWNRVVQSDPARPWAGTPMDGFLEGGYMYFVHSFYVEPECAADVLSTTAYGDKVFCSSVLRDNVFACQFHPERSGEEGLRVYHNWAGAVRRQKRTAEE